MTAKAVFFDVDFTLIFPGPTFRGEGYQQFCARYGIDVDAAAFDRAVAAAASVLDQPDDATYGDDVFVLYTSRIIEGMGGSGAGVDACAREIYREWAACHHFSLYDDVAPVLRTLAHLGVKTGLISNSHRSLASFESHFELEGLISAAVSSAEHGFMKPHPSIFTAALELVGVDAADSVMVGDSLRHDVEGALRVGMRGVLLDRSGSGNPRNGGDEWALRARGISVIRSLVELLPLL